MATSGLPTPASSGRDGALAIGDYATYTIGECKPGTFLFSPSFGIEENIDVRGCPAELRWDVLSVTGDVAEIRIGMTGWGEQDIHVANVNSSVISSINATLNAEHTVVVNLVDMEAFTPEGAYVGRWGFLLTPGEVATGRAEIVRRWYNGTAIQANVSVTNVIIGGTEAALKEAYGIETLLWAQTDINEPFPDGLERYVFTLEGGWQTLKRSGPIYDANSSLLVYNVGVHYNDVLFNLYAVIWLDDVARAYPNVFPSSLTLVDTNIIALPSSQGGETDGADEGDPEIDGQGESDGSIPSDFPWLTVVLFAVIAVAITSVAYQRFQLRRRGGA